MPILWEIGTRKDCQNNCVDEGLENCVHRQHRGTEEDSQKNYFSLGGKRGSFLFISLRRIGEDHTKCSDRSLRVHLLFLFGCNLSLGPQSKKFRERDTRNILFFLLHFNK